MDPLLPADSKIKKIPLKKEGGRLVLAKVTRQGRQKIKEWLQDVAGEIRDQWISNLEPDQKKLGEDINVFSDSRFIQVGSKNEILKFLEWGTSPHVIEAENSAALVFEWPDAPLDVQNMFPSYPTVFFKKVRHPGIKAYAHMRKAYSEVNRQ